MSNWDDFAGIDAQALQAQANNLGKSDDFPEVPNGKYEVSLDNLELKRSKSGNPMVAARFTILDGEFKNFKLFYNQVLILGNDSDAFRVHTCNTFLRSLESTLTEQVRFDGLPDYDFLISKIFEECKDAEYLLELGERKGFKTYKILERFDSSIPF